MIEHISSFLLRLNDLPYNLLFALIGALVSAAAVNVYRHRVHLADKLFVEFRNTKRELPQPLDSTSLEKRLKVLWDISPNLAILDGWSQIEAALRDRAVTPEESRWDESSDPVEVARSMLNLSNEMIATLSQLRQVRNQIAHHPERPPAQEQKGLLTDFIRVFVAIRG